MIKSLAVTLATSLSAQFVPHAQTPELAIGDSAPALDIAHWMKGDAVTTFTPGHVYVLEFWATWCGPCVANMDHLSEVQARYADRGVTVIGLSDEVLQTTVRFLLRPIGEGRLQNDRIHYSLATDPDRSVHRAYFEAAGLDGIPAVFLIGKDARVEWLGHPKDLDPVVAAVVEGTWDREAHRAAVEAEQAASRARREVRQRLSKALESEEWETAIEVMDQLIAHGDETYVPTKYGVLMSRMKQYERGYAYAREALAQAWDSDAWLCMQLGWITSGSEQFPFDAEQRDLDLALKAAKRAVELEPLDYHLTLLASIHAQREEYADAARAQARAIAQYEAKRPKIRPHELNMFEEELAELRAQHSAYEKLARTR